MMGRTDFMSLLAKYRLKEMPCRKVDVVRYRDGAVERARTSHLCDPVYLMTARCTMRVEFVFGSGLTRGVFLR